MKKAISILLVLFIIGACSAPLDATKVKVEKIDLSAIDIPVKLNAPDLAKANSNGEPEDMLGLYSIVSGNVKAENFSIEVTCFTMAGSNLEEVLEEAGNEIKAESGFEKIIQQREDGFLFQSTEINGDPNFSFIKVIVIPEDYIVVSPEPKSDGNTTREEAQYMYDILNKN
jgi:hypothetical protein